MLKNKNILLGVCGSIAAYKSAYLVRLLIKAGANVKVIITSSGAEFITPLTLSTLSNNPVNKDSFNKETGEWNNHVELALWANLFLIAPISANTLSKFANGLCDNLLTATYLSAKCNVYVAPAMDLDMWKHSSTKENILKLESFGNFIIEPATGDLASGLSGQGRMAEPEEILCKILSQLKKDLPLNGKKALVTAGPTYEAIDPVRFIGNHSSGKMGYAIAERLATLGASVTLISGPTSLRILNTEIERIEVISAKEMLQQATTYSKSADIIVMSAAVADFTVENPSKSKIKKTDNTLELKLIKTTDILEQLGKEKKTTQKLIGFALETNDELANAIAKLKKKNLDFIVLNSLQDKNAGFKGDYNKITLIDKNEVVVQYPLKTKTEVAKDICEKIVDLF